MSKDFLLGGSFKVQEHTDNQSARSQRVVSQKKTLYTENGKRFESQRLLGNSGFLNVLTMNSEKIHKN